MSSTMLKRIQICRTSVAYASASPEVNPKILAARFASTSASNPGKSSAEVKDENSDNIKPHPKDAPKKEYKTQAELDEQLRQKLEAIAGDGGEAGMELENGKPVAMKRSVKENMFRYI